MVDIGTTKFWFCTSTKLDNGDCESNTYHFNTLEEMMYTVSKAITFSAWTDEIVTDIWADNHRINYCGWLPNMEYKFVDEDGDVIWDCFYPEWDH